MAAWPSVLACTILGVVGACANGPVTEQTPREDHRGNYSDGVGSERTEATESSRPEPETSTSTGDVTDPDNLQGVDSQGVDSQGVDSQGNDTGSIPADSIEDLTDDGALSESEQEVGNRGESPSGSATSASQSADIVGTANMPVSEPVPTVTEQYAKPPLRMESCSALADALRAQMRTRMYEAVDSERMHRLMWLRDPFRPCYCGFERDGQPSDPCIMSWDAMFMSQADVGAALPPDAGSDHGGATEYTTTNNQVEGVDEIDIVKNDGNYIYLVAGDMLQIYDAWPPELATLVGDVSVPGVSTGLFVDDDRAAVFARAGSGCAVRTVVSVFDITDRSAPILERQIDIPAKLETARRIGKSIHVVSTRRILHDIPYSRYPDNPPLNYCDKELTEEIINDAFDKLLELNYVLIENTALPDMVPFIADSDYSTDSVEKTEHQLGACTDFYIDPINDTNNRTGEQIISVVSFPLNKDDRLGATSILGDFATLYASPQHFYVASSPRYSSSLEKMATTIHRFVLSSTTEAAHYRASGAVPGRLVNQFAMDEYRGHLRVAVTEGYIPHSNNHIFVLHEAPLDEGESGQWCPDSSPNDCNDARETWALRIVGEIRDLAPTEDIRSVRFAGPRGFVVTFKKTDPLFALDLADPGVPTVRGELKIPGFSTYMHFMDDAHLLTIGFDADDEESFAWFTGIMLQVFDVSEMDNPTLLHKVVIGSRGTTSDATADHLAFTYFPSRQVLALPMGICEDASGGGSYGRQMTFDGLLVFRVTIDQGFELLGGVDHRDPHAAAASSGCHNWWQNPNSHVKRSIFMDDYVYSISTTTMKINAVDALDVDVASFELPQGTADAFYSDYCWDQWDWSGGWWFP